MKFTFAIALFASALATVVATPYPAPAPASVVAETNARRFARGLPPMRPMRRATPVEAARRGSPSGVSGSCNTGKVQCCNSTQKVDQGLVGILHGLIGVLVPIGTTVGQNCSPISAAGVGGNSCSQQPVCCDSNHFNGLINVGCTPININL